MLRICHWGPLIAISIIATVTLSATYSALQLWNLPVEVVRYFRKTHFCLMYIWLVPIFWNFFKAMRGPGYVPIGWKPEDPADEKYLQYCRLCQGFKPPRSHHCRKCNRCIMKMDHHCPWINCCVGHVNHSYFIWFLFFIPFGCIHGIIVNSSFLYHLLGYNFSFYTPYLTLNTYWILFTVTGISFGAGTSLGVLILLLTQLKSVMCNRTQIEDWILEKAKHRRKLSRHIHPYTYPYDLGCYRNFCQVINLSGKPRGNGINWPVREGCNKYSFTLEQLAQKKMKKDRSVTCHIKKKYNGSRCPVFSFGLMTSLCLPCCVEATVKVQEGDMMVITRWQRKWVYGSKVLPKAEMEMGKQVKGWFPRACIQQLYDMDLQNDSQLSDTQASTHSDSQYSQLSDTDQETTNQKIASPRRSRRHVSFNSKGCGGTEVIDPDKEHSLNVKTQVKTDRHKVTVPTGRKQKVEHAGETAIGKVENVEQDGDRMHTRSLEDSQTKIKIDKRTPTGKGQKVEQEGGVIGGARKKSKKKTD